MSAPAKRYAVQTLLHGAPDPLQRSLGGSVSYFAAQSTPAAPHPALLRLMRVHRAFWPSVNDRRWSDHAWTTIRACALADGGAHAAQAIMTEQKRGTRMKRLLAALPAAVLRSLYADSRTWPELAIVADDRRLHQLVALERSFHAGPREQPDTAPHRAA